MSEQVSEKKNSSKKPNNWTVMVYLAGDNNLAEEMVYAVKSMQLVGSQPGKYEVVALYDSGLAPATIVIPEKDPPLGTLLGTAEKARKEQADEDKKAFAEAVKAAEAENGNQNEELKAPNIKDPETIKIIQNELRLRTQALRELKRTRRAADKAAEAGEPLRRESVREALAEFIAQTVQAHKAEHYMLVLSGHGSGAVGDFLSGNARLRGLSIPDLSQALDDPRVKKALGHSKKIDILGMDSCLMGMTEVAYEVREHVNFLVAAEGFEAATGWPYDSILGILKDTPAIEARDFAQQIVQKYTQFYFDYTLAEISADMSAIELQYIEQFGEGIGGENGLAALLESKIRLEQQLKSQDPDNDPPMPFTESVLVAHWKAQGYKDEQHVDVHDFCTLLKSRFPEDRFPEEKDLRSKCDAVVKAIEDLVVRADYCGPAFQHSNGISIFFPWANITDAAGVSELDFYESTLKFGQAAKSWVSFVRTYHSATQRSVRTGDGPKHLSALNRDDGLFAGTPGATGAPDGIRTGNMPFRTGNMPFRTGNMPFRTGNMPFRMTGSARLGVNSRIASMKNPPIVWEKKKQPGLQ